jgi:two-component system cell cycle response regulator DivK
VGLLRARKAGALGSAPGPGGVFRPLTGCAMTKTVLIVEDNELNMKLFHDLLEAQGYETLETREGLQALSLARLHRPDLILMDIQLPGMDGLTATALLKQDPATSAIPVIALTAMAAKADREKSQVAGCDAYIAKPLRYQELYAAIDSLLAPCRATPAEEKSRLP